jgi:acetyl-CoA acetyltransferase
VSGLRGAAAIVGVGHACLGEAPGLSPIEILAQATEAAVRDAGLKMSDVDGIISASPVYNMASMTAAEYLGIRPRFTDSTTLGGSSFVSHITPAALALEAGLCDVVLIAYGSNQRSATGRLVSNSYPDAYEGPYNLRQPITSYALAASRHMHQYGTTREQLAEVAVAARAWARLNPEAFMRGPLSIDDVLASRMISDPLSKSDCCLVTDGGGAMVVVRADRAKDMPNAPVYVLGHATAHWHRYISQMEDLTVTAATESGARACEMAGVCPADVDVLELYDAFTINTIMFLEDLGFCAKGEGGAFVSGGAIAPGGRLPVNTNGGGLSCVHPGMYGIFPFIEAVRQVRGVCGERQVDNVDIALAHGNGGVFSSQATVILGGEATLS